MGQGFQKFDDLDKILPAQIRVSGRKLRLLICGVIVALTTICVILAASLALHASGKIGACSARNSEERCTTRGCLATAARLADNMDTSVDPCSNFYRYACGGWTKRHSVSPDVGEVTVRSQLQLENDERIRELIEKPVVRDVPDSSERKLKQFFQMCVHEYGRMTDGGRGLWQLIEQHVKGWYCRDPEHWKDNGWNLNNAISDILGELNVAILLQIKIGLDWRTKTSMIRMYTGSTGMFYRSYIREDTEGIQEAYKDCMRRMAVLLLRDSNVTLSTSEQNQRVEQFVSDAYGLESQLAQILHSLRTSGDQARLRSRTVTVSSLEANYTQLPWRQIVQRSFDGFQVLGTTKVRISPFGYFHQINELLRNETTNKDRIMNNYIVWRVLFTYSKYLSWEYKHAAYRYYEIAYGREEFPATWKECLQLTRYNLASLLAAEFLQKHANRESKEQVEKIYARLKVAFYKSIKRIHWMDNETRTRAEEKVSAINRTIAFPNHFFDSFYLDQLHAKMRIDLADGFFKSFVNTERFQRHLRTRELQAGDRALIWSFVLTGGTGGSTPSYSWHTNYLMVPPGAIQYPLFDRDAPYFMNFGGLGSLMADEMSSSIDQLGRYVWANGSWANWWTSDTEKRYVKARNCFRDYFDGVKVGPFLINGQEQTVTVNGRYQTERAIDIVAGIRTALKAYQDMIRETGKEPTPIGITLNSEQAYFVAAAQTQCYVRTDELAYNYARYQFIPEDIVLNGALSHMPEFASVFKCAANSPMVANSTCSIF